MAALYFLNAKIMYVYDSLTLPKFSAELLGFQEKPFVCIFTLLSKKIIMKEIAVHTQFFFFFSSLEPLAHGELL